MTPLVSVTGLCKAYGGVVALDNVSIDILPGEVHAVCGENGAGKSTLNKILSGSVEADAGTIVVCGKQLAPGVQAAEEAGIVVVHQEPIAFPHLSAAENIFLMREDGGAWLAREEMRREAQSALVSLGETFPAETKLSELSLAQRQMVAIARATIRECKLLILDEPTASLSQKECDALFAVIRKLRQDGVSILYVSHRLEDVFELADTVTVLRDGKKVSTRPAKDLDRESLISLMVGRDLAHEFRESLAPGEPVFHVKTSDIDFTLHKGEVVGLTGLVGAGRSELARAIFGLDEINGEVLIDGKHLPKSNPARGVEMGLAYLPEDRNEEGLHVHMPLRFNLSLASLREVFPSRQREKVMSAEAIQNLSIKTSTDTATIDTLSGGNQQKALLGKWLATKPKVLILDEPTRGVDVGAKAEVHRIIGELAEEGVAILLVSSDLPEALALSDRILAMRQNKIAGELSKAEATQEEVLALALPTTTETQATRKSREFSREWAVAILLAVTLATAGILNERFFALDNLRDMAVMAAPAVMVSCSLTFVILAREIDISVGSLMGLSAAAMGIACSPQHLGLPVIAGVIACLGIGAIGGLINGALVAIGRIPSIIVTLGMLSVYRGITELLMQGKWIQNLPGGLRQFGTGAIIGIPYSVIAAALVALTAAYLATRTAFGKRVTAMGSNPRAAEIIGIPTKRLRIAVFFITGLMAGMAALFSATQLEVVESGIGQGFELVCVAAVIVGGTSIRGGQGTILGSVLGAILLGIIGTVLIFMRLGEMSTYWERAIQGGLILLAVLSDVVSRRRVTE